MESLIYTSSAINELTSSSLPSRFKLLSLSSPLPSSNPLFFPIKRRNIRRYRVHCSNKPLNSTKRTTSQPLPFTSSPQNGESLLKCVKNTVVLTLFCLVVGFIPIGALQKPAIAFSFTGLLSRNETKTETKKESRWKDHEFSSYTLRLLETVSVLLKRIEDVRSSKGNMKQVMKALQEVQSKKDELVDEIMSELNVELDKMNKEKRKLIKKSRKIDVSAEEIQENVKDREVVQDEVARLEEAYNEILEKVDDIDDKIERKETLTFSIGIRELSFIERESKLLVERFKHEVDRQNIPSVPMSSTSMHSKPEIQRELEVAQKEYWEQMLLPHALELEDTELLLDQHTEDFVLNIKQGFKESRELQKEVEASIRHKMERAGNEKRFLVKTPADEVVKGYPEAELKWVFGDKEVVVPKAIRLHLFHGWRKWREEVQTDLKTDLLENTDQVKQYVAKRQERILVDRDRVVAKTWFNEERNRWEMDPLAMPYAITKKLVDNVRIRHDWGAMFVALKGDDKEYYVDVQELDLLYEDFGGFDGLYLKMLASGIPTAVQLMWIPLSDLDIQQQFLLAMRLSYQWLVGLWKSKIVSFVRNGLHRELKNTSMDIMMMIIVPTVDLVVPFEIRMRLGMAYPERSDQVATSTKYLKWLSEVETSFTSRKKDGFRWHLWFFIRIYICGYVLFNVLLYMKKKVPRLLGFGPIRKNPIRRKWRKLKNYFLFKRRRMRRRRRRGINPIARAFDRMKRLRRVKIPLKDFASIDSMREEINEVVTFLRDPSAFQEMGARAPRGVLIVGDRGTGKTTLAAAIAAEAKVPIVVVDSKQMEAGLWVGQSASNIRELFQTARDLAPVILFVENFDLFAGVRGKYIHTKKQDHEAFINQLLVELDGFEKQDGVVLMATTRNLNKIDQALRRPGRMDRIFTLQRPTQMEREKILKTSAKSTMDDELVDFVNWEKVAEKTALLRPTELKRVPMALEASAFRSKFLDKDELRSYIGWFATFRRVVPRWLWKTKIAKGVSNSLVNHLGLTLTKENLQSAVDLMEPYGRLSPGIELLNPPHDWTRESKFPHAVWASGRALVALLLPNFDVVHNIWLEPFSWEGIGCTKITKVKDEDSIDGNVETRSYLEKKLVFCFGSYIASQMLLPFGEDNFLSSSELKQAQELATRMVIQYGWGPDDSPAIYFSGKSLTALSMGDNHEYEMATKVERMYNLAYDKAREMLQKNNTVLEKIIEELLEFEVLTGKDLRRILKENDGLVEKEPFSLSSSHHKEILSGSPPDDESASGLTLLSAPTKQ